MAIKKTKPSNVELDKMFNDVETDVQIENVNDESEEYLKTIRNSSAILRAHSEYLIPCVNAEKVVTTVLNTAAKCCDNAVTGICNAIVNAHQKAVFKAVIL